MTNGAEVELGRRLIEAKESEIIRSSPSTAKRDVELTLKKVSQPLTIPPGETPLPAPIIPPSNLPFSPVVPTSAGTKGLIINIETTGFDPLKHRIIAIGAQDPLFPETAPIIILRESEEEMIRELFTIISDGNYNEAIGYGYSFDLRFVVVRAMKLGIPTKQFSDMDIYDLMQAMAQVKFQFVYNAQRPPKLSDVADFFWGYPKPFSDLEMIKFYAQERFDKVLEFASSQVTRIMLLYALFRSITETNFSPFASGTLASSDSIETTTNISKESKLTIPEAQIPTSWTAKCKGDNSEWIVPNNQAEFICPVDGEVVKRTA